MKNKLSKLSTVCFLAVAASAMGCAHRADRGERVYMYSPPPELVAMGVADPSGLSSRSSEGLSRNDLISPPPELVRSGVVDQRGLNSGSYSSGRNDIDSTGMYSANPPDRNMQSERDSQYYRESQQRDQSADRYSAGKTAVIHFDSSTADLSESEKGKLREAIASVGADNIRRVEVAAWSDKAFPRAGNDLPKTDRDLADKRADNINDFLKREADLSFMRIRTYSMAESSNWLARTFRTDEAELKSVFSKENEAPMAREDYNLIRNEGGPSRAVVVFIRK